MVFKFISEKFKIPPAYPLVGFLGTMVFILVLGIAESFVSRVVGVAYPAIRSIYAIESPSKSDDRQWLTYWVIYGIFLFLDEYAWFILQYFPFYYFAKVLFLIWLFNPVT